MCWFSLELPVCISQSLISCQQLDQDELSGSNIKSTAWHVSRVQVHVSVKIFTNWWKIFTGARVSQFQSQNQSEQRRRVVREREVNEENSTICSTLWRVFRIICLDLIRTETIITLIPTKVKLLYLSLSPIYYWFLNELVPLSNIAGHNSKNCNSYLICDRSSEKLFFNTKTWQMKLKLVFFPTGGALLAKYFLLLAKYFPLLAKYFLLLAKCFLSDRWRSTS